jgi:pyrrolidone-carboxylate peptidase
MKFFNLLLLAFFLLNSEAQANRNILITGYWPPTNEMLEEFSPDPFKNKGLWIGKNWKNSGYDLYAYFPNFEEKDRVGNGDFPVDFTATYNDFHRLTQELKPALILSFGNGAGPWEIESTFPNHYLSMFVTGNIPSSNGEKIQYEIPEKLKQNFTYRASLPSYEILKRVNASPHPHLTARIDSEDDAGDFLCGFISYLGAWYHSEHKDADLPFRTYGSGFIHVNGDLEKAKESLNKTLEAIIESLPKQQ